MTFRDRATLVLREPLVHFMIAGALVFALLSGRPADPGERRIVVDETAVTRLVERWVQAFRRPPSPAETDGMIRDYLKEQVYYREALRLGLDRDDDVVVKRMRNKMIALATAEAEAREPSDAELQAMLSANPARYAGEPRYTLSQIYLGDDTPANREEAKRLLAIGAMHAEVAAISPLPTHFDNIARSDLVAQFGDDFATAAGNLPVGKMQGPIASGVGLHLVLVERRVQSPKKSLASARQMLVNDWRSAAQHRAEDRRFRELLDGYDVVIERPKP